MSSRSRMISLILIIITRYAKRRIFNYVIAMCIASLGIIDLMVF